jgi:hypothetical protein
MKIALCLGNLAASGRQGLLAYRLGYEHIYNEIISKYDVDIFLHSSEPNLTNELISLYNPKKYLIENNPDFSVEYSNLNTNFCDYPSQQTFSYPNLYSMAYSRYIVGQLKKEYETENNLVYDWVIFCRYDLSVGHIEKITFNPNIDNNFLYSAMFSQLNAGPQDQWFYSNSENMDIVFSLFKNLKNYFNDESELPIIASTNWIDSNISNRFSCELLLGDDLKSKVNEKIPLGAISNGHIIYKWHFYKNNFWNLNKLKFILRNDNTDENMKIRKHKNIINI